MPSTRCKMEIETFIKCSLVVIHRSTKTKEIWDQGIVKEKIIAIIVIQITTEVKIGIVSETIEVVHTTDHDQEGMIIMIVEGDNHNYVILEKYDLN